MNDLRSPGVIEKIKPKWTYIQGRLHEVKLGCRNPRERCDAAFLENREPCVHRVYRKDFWGNPGKNFW